MEMESSSSSSLSSSKRGKAPVGQVVGHCLVDGCEADLSVCRDYHRRHKVCEAHSKTPKVTIGGREQRFCQQCSRFHSLVEFDEGKRSCRKRLDGHNRRRRKPQPPTQHATAALLGLGGGGGGGGGGTLVSFTTPHPHNYSSSCWTGVHHEDNNMLLYQHQHNHNSYININAAESDQRSTQITNSSTSFHHLQNDYSSDAAALSLLSVEGETPPPIPNLHFCNYPPFPAPSSTHHHGSSSTAASHHTRTFTWDH